MLCAQNIIWCVRKNRIQSSLWTAHYHSARTQESAPGGARNSGFQWARSKTGPSHQRDAQTATWPYLAEFPALYHAWPKKRSEKLAGRSPCASSPSCRAALLKLRYKFIRPCPKGGHNLENWAKHFPIPCYLTEISVLSIQLPYLVSVFYLKTIQFFLLAKGQEEVTQTITEPKSQILISKDRNSFVICAKKKRKNIIIIPDDVLYAPTSLQNEFTFSLLFTDCACISFVWILCSNKEPQKNLIKRWRQWTIIGVCILTPEVTVLLFLLCPFQRNKKPFLMGTNQDW